MYRGVIVLELSAKIENEKFETYRGNVKKENESVRSLRKKGTNQTRKCKHENQRPCQNGR